MPGSVRPLESVRRGWRHEALRSWYLIYPQALFRQQPPHALRCTAAIGGAASRRLHYPLTDGFCHKFVNSAAPASTCGWIRHQPKFEAADLSVNKVSSKR